MTRAKLILIVAALLVFAAGTALGMLLRAKAAPLARQRRGMLTEQLNLTSRQQEQINKIWTEAMGSMGGQRGPRQGPPGSTSRPVSARQQLGIERDQKMLALLPETQRAEYESLQQEYARKLEEQLQERRRAIEEAYSQTRQGLNAELEQKVKAMLGEPRRAAHEAIQQEYARKIEELSAERQRRDEQAIERTKAVLTPEQVQKYEKLLADRQRERPGSGGVPGMRSGRRRLPSSTTAPTTNRALIPRGED
jgi:Spy/CpxP family protein refolding chaperone